MAIRCYIIVSLLVLALAADVTSQFFDFFPGLQPFQPYQVARPQKHHTEHTTRRIKGDTNRRTDKQTNKPEHTTRRHEEARSDSAVSLQFEGNERDSNIRQVAKEKIKRKQITLAPFFELFYTTTNKPIRKSTKSSSNNNSSHKNNYANNTKGNNNDNTNNKRRNQALLSECNLDTGLYDTKVNNIGEEFYITRPNFDNNNNNDYYNNRPNNNNIPNKNSNNNNFNTYTTQNPFYNSPGVKPTVIDNRPPITNKPIPVTQRPNFGTSAVSKDSSPEIISGPDEDYMSDAEKRRHIEMAERMCDKYKALNMKQLQAIPLIPSPEPIEVNVSSCAPITIPLVVGGKVVSIQEFPHMALLGWLKLNGGGYSWKCGGSLVSDQYVLTAAHCAFQERDNSVITGPPRAVQLGSTYLDDPGALVVKVSTVIRHPKYKLPKSYYDLALLKLVTSVTFSDVVRPACLGVPPSAGDHVIATGWGRTEFGGDQSTELRSVSLPVWNINECWKVLGTSRKLPDGPSAESQICAGDVRGGKDTCQGDSGGPAQIQDGCLWRIVAVTSLGRSCGAQYTPGLYAKVHRAFVAAQVFGGQKNNNNNRNNNNSNRNNNNDNNNEQQNNSFRSNGNGRSNNYETTRSDYNNYNRNNNNNNNNYYNVNNNYNNHQQNYNNFNNDNHGQDSNYYTNNYNSQPYSIINTDRTQWTW